jgi:futalosine hydrolase
MRILIIAATATELKPVLPGSGMGKQSIETLVTGVGLLSTAVALMKKINEQKPDLVIQTGIAGSLLHSLPIGKAFAVKTERIGDLGVAEEGSFSSIFKMGLADPDGIPFSSGGLTNPHGQLLELTGLQTIDAVSVNEISTQPSRIQYYQNILGASIESMEGAAFHQVCLDLSIPFVQIRGISNIAGVRDKSKWQIPLAIESSADAVKNLISKI